MVRPILTLGRPRGFGFVTFRTEDSFERALSEKHFIDDKMVRLRLTLSLT